MAGEDFDLAGAGEFGEVDGASAADAGGGGFVGGNRGELGQELARVDEERGQALVVRNSRFLTGPGARFGMTGLYFSISLVFNFLKSVGLGDVEFGDGGAAEGFEMRSAADALAHFMGDGAHVGSGGDAGAEVGAVILDFRDCEFFYFDLNGLQHDFFLFAGEFVGGDAMDFFRGEWWRGLQDCAEEFGG